jgi:hypothetical protein
MKIIFLQMHQLPSLKSAVSAFNVSATSAGVNYNKFLFFKYEKFFFFKANFITDMAV